MDYKQIKSTSTACHEHLAGLGGLNAEVAAPQAARTADESFLAPQVQ